MEEIPLAQRNSKSQGREAAAGLASSVDIVKGTVTDQSVREWGTDER